MKLLQVLRISTTLGIMILALNAYQYTSLRKRNGGTFSTSVAFTKRLCSLDLLVGTTFIMFSTTFMIHKQYKGNSVTNTVYPLLRDLLLTIILHGSVFLQCWLTVLKMMLTRKPLYKLKVTPSIVNVIFLCTVAGVSVLLLPIYFVNRYHPRAQSTRPQTPAGGAPRTNYLHVTHPVITNGCLCAMCYCYRCIYYTLVERQNAMKRKRKTACPAGGVVNSGVNPCGGMNLRGTTSSMSKLHDTTEKQDEKLGR